MASDTHNKLRRQNIKDISSEEMLKAIKLLKSQQVALFIVAYNAQKYIEAVISRIPEEIMPLFSEIFIIDDSSTDLTFEVASKIKNKYPDYNINIYRTPFNRGYGGNQKLGYLYCIEKNYDIVILLHGDGQYAPEYLPRILAAFTENTDAVFASRMINKGMALKGAMPVYKWIGNQILTFIQNKLLRSNLSEFHTGYRAYKVAALKNLPFQHNSDDFHFDTEIIIQLIATKSTIAEVPIPTHYGDEKSHVKSISYGINCIKSIIKYHLVNIGLFYSRNFDFGLFETENYRFKKSPYSLHQYILKSGFCKDSITIELGANSGILSSQIAKNVKENWAIDIFTHKLAGESKAMALNLNCPFANLLPQRYFDCCIALDVIEHLDEPELFLEEVFKILKTDSKLLISTANIAYLPMRFSLALGQFNYGKRGILDKTHKRLFTVGTFKRLLKAHGFKIEKIVGFAPPLTDLISNTKTMRLIEKIHTFFSRLYPSLFSYNFLVVATRTDSLDDIFKKTID
ncbi:MAG: bifunctional glycosyltransferase/class I SAM-dependent methyltransferase [Candidatus Jordarchaeaceae archaeon]